MDRLREQSPRLGRRVDRLMKQRSPQFTLAAHELFQDMEPTHRREFLRRTSNAALPPGIDVTRSGQRVDALYIVLDGDLKITSEDGTIGAFRAGDLFGHLELMAGQPAQATITTESPARLATIPRSLFNEIVSTQPQLLARLSQAASQLPGPAAA